MPGWRKFLYSLMFFFMVAVVAMSVVVRRARTVPLVRYCMTLGVVASWRQGLQKFFNQDLLIGWFEVVAEDAELEKFRISITDTCDPVD